jgi:hypothetical protein
MEDRLPWRVIKRNSLIDEEVVKALDEMGEA